MEYIEGGEYEIYFIEFVETSEFSQVRSMSENFDVFHSRDDIYWVCTEKSKFSFYFILFRKFSVNQLTMLQAESQ